MKTIKKLGQNLSVVQFENGRFGVVDADIVGMQIVAAGMSESQATTWAERLALRKAWGI